MATLAATVTRICDDLSRPESEIGLAVEREILSAIEHYSSERFGFNERTLQFTISATSVYSFASIVASNAAALSISDISEIIGPEIVRTYTNNRYLELERENYSTVLRMSESTLSAEPSYWAVWNKSLVFETIPPTMTGFVEGHVKLTELSSANQENAWLNEGRELIAARATAMVCKKKLHDSDLANTFVGIEIDELDRLQQRASKLASGKLRGSW